MSETNSSGAWVDGGAMAGPGRAVATGALGQAPWERSAPGERGQAAGERGQIEVELDLRDIARFWRSHGRIERGHLVAALAFELADVRSVAVRERGIGLLVRVDPELAARVARRLGMTPPDGGSEPCWP